MAINTPVQAVSCLTVSTHQNIFSRMRSQYQTAITSARNDKFLQLCSRQKKRGGNHRDLAVLLSATEKTAGVVRMAAIIQKSWTDCKSTTISAPKNVPFSRRKITIYQPGFSSFVTLETGKRNCFTKCEKKS